ncbi:MAG: transketolase [Flavobacteriaceae bacterium]|nr:transketolase [Flavobacteriaceae bacterium]
MNDYLEQKVIWVWLETLRIHQQAPETRIASSLSPIEIFVSLFYGGCLKYFADDPFNGNRDRLIVSKGHGSICLYPILADLGFFDKSELQRVCKKGGILGGIPDPIIPGYETVNGSLGHGLGVAAGISLALRCKNKSNSVFVLCGDGELQEGSCWEAIMFAGHHGLDNLNLIIDNNEISMLGFTQNILAMNSLPERLISFGWEIQEVNGHDIYEVQNSINTQKNTKNHKPKAILAKTIKGRGVPSIENKELSHVINPLKKELEDILENYDD